MVRIESLGRGVAGVFLDNPPHNLVTVEMSQQLSEVMDDLERDDSVRTVVISGANRQTFSAGADIKEFPSVRDQVIQKKLAKENEAFSSIEFLSKPVVAAIEGVALGGGCEISLACDLRIMAEDASIGLPEVKLGVLPGSGGLYRLPKLIGVARSLEMMYSGEPIDAREAEKIGLVNQVVSPGTALERATDLASGIARRPREAVAAIKRGVRESWMLAHEEAVQLTLELSDHVFKSEDAREGYAAFAEKREPRFG